MLLGPVVQVVQVALLLDFDLRHQGMCQWLINNVPMSWLDKGGGEMARSMGVGLHVAEMERHHGKGAPWQCIGGFPCRVVSLFTFESFIMSICLASSVHD